MKVHGCIDFNEIEILYSWEWAQGTPYCDKRHIHCRSGAIHKAVKRITYPVDTKSGSNQNHTNLGLSLKSLRKSLGQMPVHNSHKDLVQSIVLEWVQSHKYHVPGQPACDQVRPTAWRKHGWYEQLEDKKGLLIGEAYSPYNANYSFYI